MSQLFVLSEDTVGIQKYLAKNGLYPSGIFYRTSDIIDRVSIAGEDTLFLIIIHGMTRFAMGELNMLFDELRTATSLKATVAILSDVTIKSADFIKTGIQFVEYDGDLFFGRYTFYENNKAKYNTESDDAVMADLLNGRVKPEKAKLNHYREEFWEQFGEFTTPKDNIMEGDKPEPKPVVTQTDDKYRDKLITIELFDEQT